MLQELRFVMGAVAKRDLLPAMTHFAIESQTVRSFNGQLALCSPIPFDIDCKPKAEPLYRAIQNCKETVQLSMTPTGKLSLRSGPFKALIECVHDETPHVIPEGVEVSLDGNTLIDALKTIEDFIGDDASRPWCNGVLLKGCSAFATNNVIAVEYWTGIEWPHTVNIPRNAVRELVRIGEAPSFAQMGSNSMTFHYPDGRWLRTQLLSSEWPDILQMLNKAFQQSFYPIDEELFEGLAVLKPFTDKLGRIYMGDGKLRTHASPDEGAEYALASATTPGIYRHEMLTLLAGVAKKINWSNYPKACPFYNERVRGVIIGLTL